MSVHSIQTHCQVCSNAHVLVGLLQISHTEESNKTYSNPRNKRGRGSPNSTTESNRRQGPSGSREGAPRSSRTQKVQERSSFQNRTGAVSLSHSEIHLNVQHRLCLG